MDQSFKRLLAWMILIGLFLQMSTPIIAAMQLSNSSNVVTPEKSSILNKIREASELVDVMDFNVQILIEQVVEDAVEQGLLDKLSSALLRCYKSVSEGETVIEADVLIEAMPELLEYAVTQEKLRAVRPDKILDGNNTIVACHGDCDLTQIIRLLASIRARIGTVQDNPCCGTILGILGDACNVPCIGENGSISEVLCEILDCCTSLDITEFATVLADFKDTVTECCSEIIDTITECCAEIIDTITSNYEQIRSDIFDTQTLIVDEFEQTWTILADIKLTLTECCSEIIDTITDCCAEIRSDIVDMQVLIIDDFEGTWTILADIKLTLTECCSEIIDTITDCCAEIRSDIFDTQTLIINDFEGTWTILADINEKIELLLSLSLTLTIMACDVSGVYTVLDECCACGSIPLFQSDVSGGLITLATLGLNYCLAEDITGSIVITGANVTVDGNEHVLTGRVEIDAVDVILKNTKVNPVAPGDNTEAANAGIVVTANGTNARILNCVVTCANTLVIGINGRIGILSLADNVVIDRCDVTSGSATSNSTINGGNGGNGIILNGLNSIIDNSTVKGGSGSFVLNTGFVGGTGGNGINVSGAYSAIDNSVVVAGNAGGFAALDSSSSSGPGGIGIQINTNNVSVSNSQAVGGQGGLNLNLRGGLGGDGIEVNGDYGAFNNVLVIGGEGGQGTDTFVADGGIGININGNHGIIDNSMAIGGMGGLAGLSSFLIPANIGIGGTGGNGVEIVGNNGSIINSTIVGGFGGFTFLPLTRVANGGSGGKGIKITGDNGLVGNSKIAGGNGNEGVDVNPGQAFLTGGIGGNGGNGIEIDGNNLTIENTTVTAGNGGVGGDCDNGGPGGIGGIGILLNGNDGSINDVTVAGGNGGNGGDGSNNTGGSGGASGDGIKIAGLPVINPASVHTITDSYVIAGHAGNGGEGDLIGGNGGQGFHAIELFAVNDAIINKCIIDGGGKSGNAGAGGVSGTMPVADGFGITMRANRTQVTGCVISDVSIGIEIAFCTDITVVDNNISNCHDRNSNGAGIQSTFQFDGTQIKNCITTCCDIGIFTEPTSVQDFELIGCVAVSNNIGIQQAVLAALPLRHVYTNNFAGNNSTANYFNFTGFPVLPPVASLSAPPTSYWQNVQP